MDGGRLAVLTKICSLLAGSTRLPITRLTSTLGLIATAKRAAKLSKPKATDWAKVKEITISDFKTIKKTTVPLGDVTILVGPNGSGKSSVLQAIHWAARAASYITPKNTKEVISFDRLDYLPSSKPLSTAYFAELGSGNNQTHTSVAFIHDTPVGAQPLIATVKIWAARNKGAISAHIDGGTAVTPFKQRQRPITAYIPGLAGLAERETILAQPLMRRHAASGDAGGVLRNVLYNLAIRQGSEPEHAAVARLARLNALLRSIHPYFTIMVSFDEREDIHINASYVEDGFLSAQPLETLATGILQVLQIFAYLILFRPRLLLVDEPDAHLHPDKQERLIEALEAASREFGTQIILTTHSQHIVRAASAAIQLVWMNWGEVVSEDEKSIRTLMGWGALDKAVILFIEDEDDQAVRSILRQWPAITRQISVCKCFGVDNLPRQPMLEGLMNEGDIRLNIVLHRDRDFMDEEESELWSKNYPNKNTFTWVTKHVDVEAYYCQPDYIATLYGVDLAVATSWIEEAASKISGSKKLFKNKRELIRRVLYPDGGSPNSELLWTNLGEQTPATVLGKDLHKGLKSIVKKNKLDEHLLSNFHIPNNFEMAPDLRAVLERALT